MQSFNVQKASHAVSKPSLAIPKPRLRNLHHTRGRTRVNSTTVDADVVVAGAGVAGLATALALHRVGLSALVLEQSSQLRQEGAALGLWDNAWKALDSMGAAEPLRSEFLQLNRIQLCSASGRVLRSFPMSDAGAAPGCAEFRGVRRAALTQALLALLPQGTVQFQSRVAAVSSHHEEGFVSVQLSDGRALRCRVAVGADGARSVIASTLGHAPPRPHGYIAYRGVAQLEEGTPLPLPQDTLRQIFGAGLRAGMYPITPRECYWFITANGAAPSTGAGGEELHSGALKLASHFDEAAWGLRRMVAATPAELLSCSTIGDRWTGGTWGRGCLTLVGDAAHPMSPNLGQGGCVALEDAVELARALHSAGGASATSSALERALRDFESARSARCLPLTVRAALMGFALQIPLAPVCAVRDFVISNVYQPSHFLDHTQYNCGTLPESLPMQGSLSRPK